MYRWTDDDNDKDNDNDNEKNTLDCNNIHRRNFLQILILTHSLKLEKFNDKRRRRRRRRRRQQQQQQQYQQRQ